MSRKVQMWLWLCLLAEILVFGHFAQAEEPVLYIGEFQRSRSIEAYGLESGAHATAWAQREIPDFWNHTELALDAVGQKLYWVEEEKVWRGNTDGSGDPEIAWSHTEGIAEIALHVGSPDGNDYYWSDFQGNIYRGDGVETPELLLTYPYALTSSFAINRSTRKLYFPQPASTWLLGTEIYSIDLAASNPSATKTLFATVPHSHVWDMAVAEVAGYMYVMGHGVHFFYHFGTDSIYQINLSTAESRLLHEGPMDPVWNICVGGDNIYWFESNGYIGTARTDGSDPDYFDLGLQGYPRGMTCDPAGEVPSTCQPSDPRTLLVNGSEAESQVLDSSAPLSLGIHLPEAGGTGRYVIQLHAGFPSLDTHTNLPAGLGTMCFPLFLPPYGSAAPVAVWNNVGKTNLVGSSSYFGTPIANPAKAPTFFHLSPAGDVANLPVGSRWTIQGIITDPASSSPKRASRTNMIRLQFDQ